MGSFTFSARQRLRVKAEFDHVYRSGQRYAQAFFQAAVCSNTAGTPRLGLAVAARVAGNAVSRNRIRRIVRESFRLCHHALPPVDIVVSTRGGARGAESSALRADIDRLFAALIRPCAPS